MRASRSTVSEAAGRSSSKNVTSASCDGTATDELRSGLADPGGDVSRPGRLGSDDRKHCVDTAGCAAAVERIHTALESFERNPNERLLLESLLWSLPNASSTR